MNRRPLGCVIALIAMMIVCIGLCLADVNAKNQDLNLVPTDLQCEWVKSHLGTDCNSAAVSQRINSLADVPCTPMNRCPEGYASWKSALRELAWPPPAEGEKGDIEFYALYTLYIQERDAFLANPSRRFVSPNGVDGVVAYAAGIGVALVLAGWVVIPILKYFFRIVRIPILLQAFAIFMVEAAVVAIWTGSDLSNPLLQWGFSLGIWMGVVTGFLTLAQHASWYLRLASIVVSALMTIFSRELIVPFVSVELINTYLLYTPAASLQEALGLCKTGLMFGAATLAFGEWFFYSFIPTWTDGLG